LAHETKKLLCLTGAIRMPGSNRLISLNKTSAFDLPVHSFALHTGQFWTKVLFRAVESFDRKLTGKMELNGIYVCRNLTTSENDDEKNIYNYAGLHKLFYGDCCK
jgi:hypothetical protein